MLVLTRSLAFVTMAKQKCITFLSFLLLISLYCECLMGKKVRVGVVLDSNSTVGQMAESCISMAVSDFYAVNANYRTRLTLFTRDSRDDVVTAAYAVLDLMKNEEVQAIIGPQRSSQARFVVELGMKTHVPIISFSATSPSLSPAQNKYFIRTAQDDSSQVKAIATIVKAYGWREIVPIYEDTEFGNGLVPYLLDAFQEIDTRVPYGCSIPLSISDTEIMRELNKLKAMQKSIFVVHMTSSLGSRLFLLAKAAGMMIEGYAWLVTDGLSNLLDPVGSKVVDSMQGVLGVRPYIPKSIQLEDFKSRWKKNLNSNKPNSRSSELNLFGLWAYDTVWAIAMAVEKAGLVHSSFMKKNARESKADDLVAELGISKRGTRLLNSILRTRFQGLTGDFHLVKGERVSSAFEIFNVIGKTERIIGYWTAVRGLSKNLDNHGKLTYSTSKNNLKQPIWPGDTTDQPKKLRVGVPVTTGTGFTEIMRVDLRPGIDKPIVSGFCLDVFLAVLEVLPFPLPYEFIPYSKKNWQTTAGTYNEFLYQIKLKKFDVAVGDTTIVASRSSYVDFTLPYSESGVTMVVLMKPATEKENMWIFLKPLSVDLWLTTGTAFIFTGLVVWMLEHRINTEFRGPPEQQLGTIFWFSFSTLVFAHRERVVNNWTRFVLIIWIFVILILSQSYTASLASMLTVQRLQPTFVDVKEIQRNGYFVGYQRHSFVKDFLIKQLNFNENLLRSYKTPEEYKDALSKGTHNGGVAAIFDEIPYIKLFLAKYCSNFEMVGPIYQTDGFGFAFPLGSPLVQYFSRAILNVTEDKDKMEEIERRNFGGKTTCEVEGAPTSTGGLQASSFRGLFIITGVASTFSLLIYAVRLLYSNWPATSNTMRQEGSFCLRIRELAKHFDKKDTSADHYEATESGELHPVTSTEIIGVSPSIDNAQSSSWTSSEGVEIVVREEREEGHSHFTSGTSRTNIDDAVA